MAFDVSTAPLDPASRRKVADMTALLAVQCQGDPVVRMAIMNCAVSLTATIASLAGETDAGRACETFRKGVQAALDRAEETRRRLA